jgi:hypothetical protein
MRGHSALPSAKPSYDPATSPLGHHLYQVAQAENDDLAIKVETYDNSSMLWRRPILTLQFAQNPSYRISNRCLHQNLAD